MVRTAVVLAAVALVLRVAFVLLYPQFPFGQADDGAYDELGWSLASGTGFSLPAEAGSFVGAADGRVPAIGAGPTYPVFLSAIYLAFGHRVVAVRLVQAVLGAVLVLLVWQLARAAAFPRRTAATAAALTAVYPAFIIYTGMVLTEILFTCLLAASVWALLRAASTPAPWRWGLAGCAVGLTILLRSEAIAIVPLAGAVIAYHHGVRRMFGGLLLFVTVAGLVAGLWTLRNFAVFGEFVPVSANAGRTLWISTRPWEEWRVDDPELQALVRGLTEIEADRVLGRAAVQNILAAPADYAVLSLKRIPRFWLGSHTTYLAGFGDSLGAYAAAADYRRLFVKLALIGGNVTLVALAVAGAWRAVRAGGVGPLLLLVPIVGLSTVHVFFFATSRYQVPIMPFVLVFAALALTPRVHCAAEQVS